jgi:hypothetical protein
MHTCLLQKFLVEMPDLFTECWTAPGYRLHNLQLLAILWCGTSSEIKQPGELDVEEKTESRPLWLPKFGRR